jgi:hypothetical protein
MMSEGFRYATPELNPEAKQIAQHLETLLTGLKNLPGEFVQVSIYIDEQSHFWVSTDEKMESFSIEWVREDPDKTRRLNIKCPFEELSNLAQDLRDAIYCGEDCFMCQGILYMLQRQNVPTIYTHERFQKDE